MKKVLQPFVLAALVIPCAAFANAPQAVTASSAQANNGQVTVESPRTGIRYTFSNPDARPVVVQTAAITAANASSAERIVASNPALSLGSQQKAKQVLVDEAAQLAKN